MPALIAVFAVGAYGFGSALRGSDVIVNEVAIVRGAPDATEGSAQVYLGVFSPTRGTYQLTRPGRRAPLGTDRGDFFGGQGARRSTSSRATRPVSATWRSGSARCGRSGPRRRSKSRRSTPTCTRRRRRQGHDPERLGRWSSSRRPSSSAATSSSWPTSPPGEDGDGQPAARRGASSGSPLSDKIFGHGLLRRTHVTSNEKQRRNQTRHRIVDQLTYDPMSGILGQLPSDGPVAPRLGATQPARRRGPGPEAGADARTFSTTSRCRLRSSGTIAFATDLIRSTVSRRRGVLQQGSRST